MSEMVAIPRSEWENLKHSIDFIKKVIQPLAKGYKADKWMTSTEVMEMLQIGSSRLKQLRQSGKIRFEKPATGRAVVYWREDIEDYRAGNIIIGK